MQFESRDGHLRALYQTDEHGREELHVYDHHGNLLDVLRKVVGSAPAAGSSTALPNGHVSTTKTGDAT